MEEAPQMTSDIHGLEERFEQIQRAHRLKLAEISMCEGTIASAMTHRAERERKAKLESLRKDATNLSRQRGAAKRALDRARQAETSP
jgi:hypothetical protein